MCRLVLYRAYRLCIDRYEAVQSVLSMVANIHIDLEIIIITDWGTMGPRGLVVKGVA